jgi:hypothetical protein
MSTVALDRLPSAVQEIENLWIPLSDGCRLAARLWLPDSYRRTKSVRSIDTSRGSSFGRRSSPRW